MEFIIAFSAGCVLVGLAVVVLMWAGVKKAHIIHPRNPRLQIVRAHGLAIAIAGIYSLCIFCPAMDWLGSWSPGLAFGWFLLASPIWVFVATLYGQPSYRVATNNLS